MRKRTLLALFVSILFLVLTNKTWLIYKPVLVHFDANYTGEVQFIADLNKQNNFEFKKFKSGIIKRTGKSSFRPLDIKVKRCKRVKAFRLSLAGDDIINKKIIINNVWIRKPKYSLNNYNKYESKNAELTVNNNSLVIIPKSKKCSIYYKEPLNIRATFKFEFLIFTIIFILSFALFYKLTYYLADFKISKNHSRLDILFILVCTIILFIPMSHISQAKRSECENRNLAKWKPFIKKDGSINYNFGKDFDSYFSDRFAKRDELLDLYVDLTFNLSGDIYKNRKAFVNKKNGFCAELGALNRPTFKEGKEFQNAEKHLLELKQFCDSNNIKPYILVTTRPSDIYKKELLPFKDKNQDIIELKQYEQITKDTGIPIIHPIAEIKEASKYGLVHFKTDGHWTDYGAYIGYSSLMNVIRKDFPNIHPVMVSDYNIDTNNTLVRVVDGKLYHGLTASFLKLSEKQIKKLPPVHYPLYEHKKSSALIIDKQPDSESGDYFYPEGADLRAVFIGTSFAPNQMRFIPYTFTNTRYISIHSTNEEEFKILKNNKEQILEYKPQILIFCLLSGKNIFDFCNNVVSKE